MVDGNPVDLVESFTYLGSIQTSDGYCRSNIARRIGLASSAMSSLKAKHLSVQIKVRVYQTLVLSVLLYASETWTSLASDMKAIKSFHMKCQRRILGSRWHDFVRNSGSLYALVSHLRLTGLPDVAMRYSDMWQDCRITFPHTRPCYAKSSYRSVDSQTLHVNIHQVDHMQNGPTNSAAITTRSSATAEEPRDASCQLKSCQLPRNSAETLVRQVLNKSKLRSWRVKVCQCVINMCIQPVYRRLAKFSKSTM